MDSILDTIKDLLGLDIEDDSYDTVLIVNINTVISLISQQGIGPSNFMINDRYSSWEEYGVSDLPAIKSLIYMKVKMLFDPPIQSAIISAFENSISELEFRLSLPSTEGGE